MRESEGKDNSRDKERVGLDGGGYAGAETEGGKGPLPTGADGMEGGRDDNEEEGGLHQVALASLADAIAGVEKPEEGGADTAGEGIVRPGGGEHGGASGEQEKGIEGSPGDRAGAKGVDDGPIHHERAGEVHIGDLAIRSKAGVRQEGDVVLEGAVVDEGPMAGEDEANDDEGKEPDSEGELGMPEPGRAVCVG